jgi:DNA-binding FrmR family transcriptional regulator
MTQIDIDGWTEYKQRVIFQLDQLTDKVDRVETMINEIRENMAILKTKATVYGSLAGLAITIIMQFVFNYINHIPK